MASRRPSATEREIEAVLPLHFQVPVDFIPLTTFIRTARSAELLMLAVNDFAFGGQLEFEVIVLPSEIGTFKSKLGICILGGVAAAWNVLDSDIGAGFVKGLTDQEPAYWSEQLGKDIKDAFATGTLDTGEQEKKQKALEKLRGQESQLLIDLSKCFLTQATSKLHASGITTRNFSAGYEARNEFYGACILEKSISAVGFTDKEEFPIPRSNFDSMRVPIPPAEEDHTWNVEISEVRVTSPNWDRTDQHRYWKGRDSLGKERLFRIDDEHFWQLAHDRVLNVSVIDSMIVQWAYKVENNRAKSFRVLRVIAYNGETLSDPFDGAALESLLGRYHYESSLPYQPDLFG